LDEGQDILLSLRTFFSHLQYLLKIMLDW
jgi:hypothetical protein